MRVPRLPQPVRPRPRSLAGQLFAVQVVLVAAVVAGCAVFAYLSGKAQARESATHRARATTQAVADSPSVREAIRSPDPSRRLQPYAERVRRDTGVTFVTIMDTKGTRWTHPDPDRIGERFAGHIGPALRGRTFDETYTGTLGPSVRVVTPVRAGGPHSRIVGLVSAGIAVDTIGAQVREQLAALVAVAGGALALGGLGTYVVNARLRRHTHGMNAAELSRLHDYHQATLHAVREGLLLLDGDGRVALANDAARDLLGLTERSGPAGRPVTALGLPRELTQALLAAGPRRDEVHLTADRVLVVSTSPVDGGERRGTVVTLRDHTELRALAGELDSVRGFAEALRSQAHEAANRLHTVVSLIELGRAGDAVAFATEELQLAQALTDRVVSAVGEPVLAALLLGKAAQASERGVELTLSDDSQVADTPGLPARDLVTVLGNLIDNAIEALTGPPPGGAEDPPPPSGQDPPGGGAAPRVTVTLRHTPDGRLLLRVADNGPGLPAGRAERIFDRGWSTKPGGSGIGLALVRQTARRHGGTVHSGRPAGGGAEFTVTLPVPDPVPAPVPAPRSGAHP
ncbi:sensor histidine kinase [Streptomyces albus subsp. chlorinus]|uniref:ATP-binding protein n=1 Tax=Streptomyces albus TaxID=1888 RepID=UPI00156DC853|nr:sensor histidine kinase [Streptomyces albus]NSC23984.1 sensor histidine kinase [Streptomyces albus subsp. chlorinus]